MNTKINWKQYTKQRNKLKKPSQTRNTNKLQIKYIKGRKYISVYKGMKEF